MEEKLVKLRELISDCGKLAVAFSGGVDSTFLLAVAREVLGEDVLAVMAVSPLVPRFELRDARYAAEDLDVRLIEVNADPMAISEVRGNSKERCYFCKHELFESLKEAAQSEGFDVLADGTNADDADAYRPGAKALEELGVKSPLLEAGLTKREIREAARAMGLPNWDKPSCSCLATRIPYDQPLEEDVLARIDAAEDFLRRLDFDQCRVRLHGDVARIEVSTGQIARLAEPMTRNEVVAELNRLGFDFITLDLEGFRSGSFDRHN